MVPTLPAESELLTLPEAARSLPGKPHPCTLWRWRSKGIRGVRLRSTVIGGRCYVTRQALAEFVAALSGFEAETEGDGETAENSRESRRRPADTQNRLAAEGLLRKTRRGRRRKLRTPG
jgi:hypothetical protein